MKHKDIKIGGHYLAKVDNKLVVVQVDGIRTVLRVGLRSKWLVYRYDVTNCHTNLSLTFSLCSKFREVVNL